MAIAKVQQVGGSSGSSTSPAANTGAVGGTFTAGNLLIAVVHFSFSGTGTGDTIGTPSGWTIAGSVLRNGAPNGVAWAGILPNNPGGAQTWTWTYTPGTGNTTVAWAWTIFEFSGADTSSPLDLAVVQAATGASASSSADAGAASGTTLAADLLIELVGAAKSTNPITWTSSASSVPTSGWTVGTEFTSSRASGANAHVTGQFQVLGAGVTSTNPHGILTSSATTSNEAFLLTVHVPVAPTVLPPPPRVISQAVQRSFNW